MNVYDSPLPVLGNIVVLAQLFASLSLPYPVLDWWLPATLTCPLVPAQIPLSVQETRNILSETLPGCVYCLEIFKVSALFAHDSDMVAPRRRVHPSGTLPEGDQSFVSQTRVSMQPDL